MRDLRAVDGAMAADESGTIEVVDPARQKAIGTLLVEQVTGFGEGVALDSEGSNAAEFRQWRIGRKIDLTNQPDRSRISQPDGQILLRLCGDYGADDSAGGIAQRE